MAKKSKKAKKKLSLNLDSLEQRRHFAWGTFPQLIDQDLAAQYYPQYNGAGTTIVNIDSGVNAAHPVLQGKLLPGWDFVNNDSNPADDQGHGTMTGAFMVANKWTNTGNTRGYSGDGKEYGGIAPGAKLVSLKVVTPYMSFNINHVEQALRWTINNRTRLNIQAVNMSLDVGQSGYYQIQDELQQLWNNGVVIGASSGNGGNTNGYMSYPAYSNYAMSVGGLNPDGSVTWSTSRGPNLDILAPGNQ